MINIDGIEYLTATEAAELLGVKVTTLYAYASRGRIRSYRRGIKRERFYRRAEVEALLRVRPSAAGSDDTETNLPLAETWIPYS
ncbi:helix-turn-helix domain-containing protein [Sphaerobacter sp.]|uniref:helix-turn-helix domain-containing protein n=1 Tax=Sphaerobacter sp. TaxID=2099654 RepID=UPI001D667DAB|nr:helix-turn-helix domain-containing protein [Sphaerobacter sp.]MBX5444344.1 helix-turn-helix domain-containing protein [Sphaerobacter sp.]